MKDRQPTPGMEGRVKITPEDGSPAFYARIEMADHPLEKGTPIDTANLFSGATQILYPEGTETVNDALSVIPYSGWQEISKFDVAGDYEWISDFDGIIGVLVIGGGGSGYGIDVYFSVSHNDGYLGGASGFCRHQIMKVSKGQKFDIHVGRGGRGQSSWGSESGEASYFSSLNAPGGGGGVQLNFNDYSYQAVDGGQAAYLSSTSLDGLFGGVYVTNNGGLFGGLGASYGEPWNCKNPFTGDRILGSGGGVIAQPRGAGISVGKGGKNPLTRLGGGDASGAIDQNATGQDGTAPGCGGGAAVSNKTNSEVATTATSGSGADGAVIIYRKWVL